MNRGGWKPCAETRLGSAGPMRQGMSSPSSSTGGSGGQVDEKIDRENWPDPFPPLLDCNPRFFLRPGGDPDRGSKRMGIRASHLAHRKTPSPRHLLGGPPHDRLPRLDLLLYASRLPPSPGHLRQLLPE